MSDRVFQVGTFVHQGKRRPRFTAYTLWYDSSWPGCKVYTVRAKNGAEAKKKAIEMRKREEAAP